MAQLTEQYRPSTWAEVIGQPKTLEAIDRIRKRAGTLAGRAYLITGASGTGKTSIARLIAREVAGELAIQEENAREIDAAYVERMTRTWATTALAREGEPIGRAWIFNEVHNLRKSACDALLTALEAIPPHTVIVFTTTQEPKKTLWEDYEDASPLTSRCTPLHLARRDLAEPFAQRAKEIAEKEGLDGRPVAQYVRLLQDCRNNMRQALQRIEAGEMVAE